MNRITSDPVPSAILFSSSDFPSHPLLKVTSITPFKIDVPEATIERLRQKLALSDFPSEVTGIPKDLIILSKLWHHTMGPVVFDREHTRGGHFAAWECPDALVEDLRSMFGKGGGAYSCMGGRNGYDTADGH